MPTIQLQRLTGRSAGAISARMVAEARVRFCAVALACALVVVIGGGIGCGEVRRGRALPERGFYYPVGMALDGKGRVIVVNSNFDQRFQSGWVNSIDVEKLTGIVASMETLGGSVNDQAADQPSSAALAAVGSRSDGGALAVLSLAAQVEVSETHGRAFVAHRGTGKITEIELGEGDDQPALYCGDPDATAQLNTAERRTDCDIQHLIAVQKRVLEQKAGALADFMLDPLAMAADDSEHMVVSFASSRFLAIFNLVEAAPRETAIGDQFRVFRSPLPGYAALAQHPDVGGSWLFGVGRENTSRSSPSRIASLDIDASIERLDHDDNRNMVAHTHELGQAIGGAGARGLAFVCAPAIEKISGSVVSNETDEANQPDDTPSCARRLALVTPILPGALAVVAATPTTVATRADNGEFGDRERAGFSVLDSLALGGQPTDVTVIGQSPMVAGSGSNRLSVLVAVALFDQDRVLFVELFGDRLQIVGSVEDVGAGPHNLVVAPTADGGELLFVSLFHDHAVAVIDLRSSSPVGFGKLVPNLRNPETPVTQR